MVDDEVVKTTELSADLPEWWFDFSRDTPGQYHVEIIVEGEFPGRLGHLYEQDALEFDNTEARAAWDVVVTPGKQKSKIGRVWGIIKEFLAIYSLATLVQKVYLKVRELPGRLRQAESEEAEDVNATLDDFQTEDASDGDSGGGAES